MTTHAGRDGPGREDADVLRAENERLRAEVEELNARYRLLVDGVAGAVWEWEPPTGAARFSDRWVRLRGYEPGELKGNHEEWSSRIHPEDAPRVLAAARAHLDGLTPEFLEEYRALRKDGTSVWVLARGVALRDAVGRAVRMSGSDLDITARREAEERLIATLRLLRAAQEMGHVGSWEVDVATGAERWTDEVFRILGLDPGAHRPVPSTFDAAVHPDDLAAVDEAYEGSLARGDDAYDMTFRIVRRDDGRVRWVRDQCMHEKDASGTVIRRIGTFQDITEYQEARQEIAALNADLERRVEERTTQLQEAVTELEAFAYAVSHDLRAPLRSIDGFSHVLAEDYGTSLDDRALDTLARIRAGAQRMGALIDGLLEISRLNRARMHLERLDMSSLAQEVCDELAAADPGRQVDVVIHPDLHAFGDAALVRALLYNLLGNAWRFTSRHETARIEFGARTTEEGRAFYVRDDGAGFDMAYAGKLFTAFQRLHTTDQFDGTGIGLATVQRIVHRHGGSVWAEGAVEQGATFSFTLPDAED